METIGPLPRIVYGAMEQAAQKTRSFFDDEKQNPDERPDAFLAPDLMRFYGKRFLRSQGIQAEDDGESSDLEALSNNGLAFFYRRHHVRILKAAEVKGAKWKLPGCGLSARKRAFYDQQLIYYWDSKGTTHPTVLNIIFLWDFDQVFNLAGIHMGCPQTSGTYAHEVKAHWCQPVPHPATIVQLGPPQDAQALDEEADREMERLLDLYHETDGDQEKELGKKA